LASQGGVCSVINDSCCSYIDQSGRITADLKEMWKQVKIFHEVAQDDTSWGFEEIWEKLTWVPNLSWLRQLFLTVLVIIGMVLITYITVQCSFWCCKQSIMNYEEWKRNKIKHQVETGKYFRKL
ncbi:ERVV2 protein, partial [Eolophus roseicapillus]|nr:ERVV2 protein [Eolophus roseicapilla]